jgi:hypothetical protein
MNNQTLFQCGRNDSFWDTIRHLPKVQPDKLFLFLAVPFGLIFLLLSAPFQAPDEFVHFYRAYDVSEGHFASSKVALPNSVLIFSQTVSKDLAGNYPNKQSKKH